jgi:hypothetical protein
LHNRLRVALSITELVSREVQTLLLARLKKAILVLAAIMILASVTPGLPWSANARHKIKKLIAKAKIAKSRLFGAGPRLVSITGQTGVAGIQVQALDSKSGWATLCDRRGKFVLPDVEWYPGASYDLIISTDEETGRLLSIEDRAPNSSGLVDIGSVRVDWLPKVKVSDLPGDNSYSYQHYDLQNRDYYRDLFDELTSGLTSDEEKVEALNKHVSEKLSYDDPEWDVESPRRVLEHGSQYCGHLSAALATLVAVAFPVRIVQLTDGSDSPNTHVVVEVKYQNGWHLFDPTFGIVFKKEDGTLASYKDLRLDPELLARPTISQANTGSASGRSTLPEIYRTGYHHYYYLAYSCSQYAHAWWAYENGLEYVDRGGRILFAAAGIRPGTNVTYHIRKPGADYDQLTLRSINGAGANCVLDEEESPPIELDPGKYDVFIDLCDGNISDPDSASPARISNWHLAIKLDVR